MILLGTPNIEQDIQSRLKHSEEQTWMFGEKFKAFFFRKSCKIYNFAK